MVRDRYHSDEEKNRFERSLCTTIRTLEKQYNCDIYLQGDAGITWKSSMKRFINCFSSCLRNYNPPRREELTAMERIRIDHSLPKDNHSGMYDIYDSVDTRNMAVIYHDRYDKTLGYKDTLGNIWTCDFYHSETSHAYPFPELHDIIGHAWDEKPIDRSQKVIDDLDRALKDVSSDKIERIKIETSFNKEAYIELIKREFETAIDLHSRISESKVTSLSRTLESERKTSKKRMLDACNKSFTQGVSLLRKNKDWELQSDGRLYYKKEIVVTHATVNGNRWAIPVENPPYYYIKGLSVLIDPSPTQAMARDHRHPNVSESGSVCIGDLYGKPLAQVLKELPSALVLGGLNSPFNGAVASQLMKYGYQEDGIPVKDKLKKNKVWASRK